LGGDGVGDEVEEGVEGEDLGVGADLAVEHADLGPEGD